MSRRRSKGNAVRAAQPLKVERNLGGIHPPRNRAERRALQRRFR